MASRRLHVLFVLAAALLAGCQAEYSAEVANHTAQPLYANIFRKGSGPIILGDTRYVEPGATAFVGPVRNSGELGAVLSVESVDGRGWPVKVDLRRGTSQFEVEQARDTPDAPLRIVEKK